MTQLAAIFLRHLHGCKTIHPRLRPGSGCPSLRADLEEKGLHAARDTQKVAAYVCQGWVAPKGVSLPTASCPGAVSAATRFRGCGEELLLHRPVQGQAWVPREASRFLGPPLVSHQVEKELSWVVGSGDSQGAAFSAAGNRSACHGLRLAWTPTEEEDKKVQSFCSLAESTANESRL